MTNSMVGMIAASCTMMTVSCRDWLVYQHRELNTLGPVHHHTPPPPPHPKSAHRPAADPRIEDWDDDDDELANDQNGEPIHDDDDLDEDHGFAYAWESNHAEPEAFESQEEEEAWEELLAEYEAEVYEIEQLMQGMSTASLTLRLEYMTDY